LLKKAEEVDGEGGVQRIESLLKEVQRLSRANSKVLYDVRVLHFTLFSC
jgi:hypothetical protein